MAWTLAREESKAIKPHICICVPHWGQVSLEWVQSTWGPLSIIAQPDFDKSYKLGKGLKNLDTERNMLAQLALEDKTVTHILWLDTDNVCEQPKDPNQALRMLLQCNAPIASGLYRSKKQGGQYPYAMWVRNPEGDGYLTINEWTGNWIKVDVIGMGFCLMKREVFEKVPFPWFVWDKREPSEDFEFCEKLAKYGYEVRVFTDVRLSHIGLMKAKTDGSITTLDV